ncbi:MAG: SGNH/GDSL hydrolase family protein [Lachnospiraceae bacterium]|nr:SGNH/GDSL hydrolase family protein [Lachnospiraceae bacterium]
MKKTILVIEGIIAAIAVIAVVVVCLLPSPGRDPKEPDTGTSQTAVSSLVPEETTKGEESSSETEPGTERTEAPSSGTTAEPPTDPPTVPTTAPPTLPPTVPSETTTAPPVTEPPVEAPDYSKIVFVGDSRTKTMATGGQYEFRLVPDDSVCATWGGKLYDESILQNTRAAVAKKRPIMVFWLGINDVQVHPERDNVDVFIANYDKVLSMTADNPGCTVYVLSILTTTVRERDYYEGQNENIRRYNEALQAYCGTHGYVFVDISALFTGDECFYPGDNIHFSEEWYRTRFLPTVLRKTGLLK